MMKTRYVGLVAAVAMLLVASTATADWMENFNGSYQQSWTFGNLTGLGGSSPTFTSGIVSNTLQLTDPTSAALGGAGAGFGFVSESFTDVTVFGTVNPSGDSNINGDIGLLARANLALLQAYALTADYAGGGWSIDITRNNSNGTQTNLASGSLTGVSSTDSLYLRFDVIGSSLTGRFYDQFGGSLLGTISGTDSSYASGAAGVVVNASVPTSALRGTFDDVGARVPEPASLVMLSSGALVGLGLWRRRRRNKA